VALDVHALGIAGLEADDPTADLPRLDAAVLQQGEPREERKEFGGKQDAPRVRSLFGSAVLALGEAFRGAAGRTMVVMVKEGRK
jgi:hypothetical protein